MYADENLKASFVQLDYLNVYGCMESRFINQNLRSLPVPSCYNKKTICHVTDGTSSQIPELSKFDGNQLPGAEQFISHQSMELCRDNTEDRSGLRLSRAIYGGHISGRRLRGVKMNPIYQENNSDFWDSQSESIISSSHIQIKTYESLPRHHFISTSSSVPDIPYACSTSMSRVPYVCNGRMTYLGKMEQKDPSLHFSDCSRLSRGSDNSVDNEGTDFQTDNQAKDTVRSVVHARPWSWPHSDRGHRKQLMRQQGIDVTSDGMRTAENIQSGTSACTSSSPSRAPMSPASASVFAQIKCRKVPRIFKKTILRKTKLSILREQSTSTENDQSGVSENEQSGLSDTEQYDVRENKQCRVSDTNFEIHRTDG